MPLPRDILYERAEKEAEVVRTMVRHEDSLVNNRITWFTTVQSLAFAALGFTWDKESLRLLAPIVCVLGALTAYSASLALLSSNQALERLKNHKIKHYKGIGVMGFKGMPVPERPAKLTLAYCRAFLISKTRFFFKPWRILPVSFGVIWLSLGLMIGIPGAQVGYQSLFGGSVVARKNEVNAASHLVPGTKKRNSKPNNSLGSGDELKNYNAKYKKIPKNPKR